MYSCMEDRCAGARRSRWNLGWFREGQRSKKVNVLPRYVGGLPTALFVNPLRRPTVHDGVSFRTVYGDSDFAVTGSSCPGPPSPSRCGLDSIQVSTPDRVS